METTNYNYLKMEHNSNFIKMEMERNNIYQMKATEEVTDIL